jgi:hypothetical protein
MVVVILNRFPCCHQFQDQICIEISIHLLYRLCVYVVCSNCFWRTVMLAGLLQHRPDLPADLPAVVEFKFVVLVLIRHLDVIEF